MFSTVGGSHSTIIKCNHESCVKEEVSKSNIQSKTPSRVILTRDNTSRIFLVCFVKIVYFKLALDQYTYRRNML
jgi:hypothetical protein